MFLFSFVNFFPLPALVKMIEPELAFADLNDDMACATAYLQYVVCYLSNPFLSRLLSNYSWTDLPKTVLTLTIGIVIFLVFRLTYASIL